MFENLFDNSTYYNRILSKRFFIDGEFDYFIYTNKIIFKMTSLKYDMYLKYLIKDLSDITQYFYIGLMMLGFKEEEAINIDFNLVPVDLFDIVVFSCYKIINLELSLNNFEEKDPYAEYINKNPILDSLYFIYRENINVKNNAQIYFINNKKIKEKLMNDKNNYELAFNISRAVWGNKDISSDYQSLINQINNGVNTTKNNSPDKYSLDLTEELTGKNLNTVDGLIEEVQQMKEKKKDLHDEVINAYELYQLSQKNPEHRMDSSKLNPKLKARLDKILNTKRG